MEDAPKYPNHLKEEIKRRGYTLREVAKQVYVSERALRNYCAGRRLIPRATLEALARFLECPLSSLVDGGDTHLELVSQERGLLDALPASLSPATKPFIVESVVLRSASGQQMLLVTPEYHHSPSPLALQAYEDVLSLAWEAFYTSCAQRSAGAVSHWLLYLAQVLPATPGTLHDQLLAIRCRFLQLSSVLARDRAAFQQAFEAINEAILLAVHLQDAELMASSLYRRSKIYVKQQIYHLAIQDLEAALPYTHRCRDPLRCYILMLLAETYSLFSPTDTELSRKSLQLLDEVDQTVRAYGVLEGDGSFVKVDVAGLYMIRGDVLRRTGHIKAAQQALLIVRGSLPKEFIRWQGNLCLSEAQLALADGDMAGGCQLALRALDVIDATRSQSNREEVSRLYSALLTSGKIEPSHPRLKELGTRLGVA